MNLLDEFVFEIAKGSRGPEDKVDAKFVEKMLKENDLYPDFTAKELYKVWMKS